MKISELMKRWEGGFRGLIQAGTDEPVMLGEVFDIEVTPEQEWAILFDVNPQSFLQAIDFYASGKVIKCVLDGVTTTYDKINTNGVPIAGDYILDSTHVKNPWGYMTASEILSGTWYVSTE